MEDTQGPLLMAAGSAFVGREAGEDHPHPSPRPGGEGERAAGAAGADGGAPVGGADAGFGDAGDGLQAQGAPPVDVEVLRIALAAAEADRLALTAALDQERAARADAEASLTTARTELGHAQDRHGGLEETLRLAQAERNTLAEGLRAGAERYRAALLAASPEVPPELVTGATMDEVDRSLAAAQAMVAAVAGRLAAHAAAERVPAGSPTRSGGEALALTARQKIALALSR